MSNELENVILTIDTREQNQRRIKAVENWALSHGAIVEHSALSLCDYWLLGEFRDVPVNVGIEAKAMPDFATSYSELSDKLTRSYQLYDDVALFVEAGNYTFIPDADNFHAMIDNPLVRNGNADVLPLAVYENMLASFQREGIHVRQLRSEAHFPYAIAGLLISITKPIHTGLHIKSKDFTSQYLNVLAKVPHISMARATKLIKNYPNLNWLCGASEESYKQVLGNKTGSELYAFIRCHDLETEEWRNNYHRDGTEKIITLCGQDCYNPQHCDETCERHPDHFKHHSSHQDKDITSVKHGITPYPSLSCDTSQSLSTINIGRRSIDMPQNLNTYVIHGTHDTSSHLGTFPSSVTHHQPDDPQRPPITYISEVKQEVCHIPPAETNMDIGLDDKRTEYREVKPNVIDPKAHKMNLDMTLKEYMADSMPHLMQDIVDHCEGWGTPYIFDRVMANVKSGNIQKMTDSNGKITYQRIT